MIAQRPSLRVSTWCLACILLALTAGACKSSSSAGNQPAAKQEPYKIGVTYPLTGPLSSYTNEFLPAAQLAIDQANSKGGVNGHPLQFVVEDTKGTPEGGVEAFRKVVQVDNVQAVLTIFTNVVTAQIPLADQLKVPFICPVESPGLVAKGQYSFAHSPTFAGNMPPLEAYWKAHGIKKIFAFYPDNAIADYNSPITKASAKRIGADYAEAKYTLGQTDYRGVVEQAKTYQPDAILIESQGTVDDGLLIKQLREIGVNTQLYSGENNFSTESWRKAVGPYTEGMIMSGLYLDGSTPAQQTFIDAYKAKTGQIPGQVPAQVYDMTNMLIFLIQKDGYNAQKIRDGLASLKDFPSVVGGKVTIGKDHQSTLPGGLWKVENNQLVAIKANG